MHTGRGNSGTSEGDLVAAQLPDGGAVEPEMLLKRIESLLSENDVLGREYLRCHDQLNTVFEITEQVARLDDPSHIEAAVICRWGATLNVDVLYVDDGERCDCVVINERPETEAAPGPDVIREVLAEQIERCRRRPATIIFTPPDDARHAKLDQARLLISALIVHGRSPRVVVALRPSDRAEFEAGDVLAADAILGYGGHVLSNALMMDRLRDAALDTVRALANAIDAKDQYTCGHSVRVGWLARLLGERLGLTGEALLALEWGGTLHDVGKIGINEAILTKPGRLTDQEYREIQEHPRISYAVLKPVAVLQPALSAVLRHHENHDGSGYPDGLEGERIPLGARIIHVVDIFDALTSTRSYRIGHTPERAFEILRSGAGRVTDPVLTEIFIETFSQYMRDEPDDFANRFPHISGLAANDADAARATPPSPFGLEATP